MHQTPYHLQGCQSKQGMCLLLLLEERQICFLINLLCIFQQEGKKERNLGSLKQMLFDFSLSKSTVPSSTVSSDFSPPIFSSFHQKNEFISSGKHSNAGPTLKGIEYIVSLVSYWKFTIFKQPYVILFKKGVWMCLWEEGG